MSETRYTPAQQAAIEAEGRTLVAAAAGSGKTTVLVERVVRALCAGRCAPAELCAVTFTEKAAQELRERLGAALSAAGRGDLVAELELARIGTIHSLCAAILADHGAAVGIDPNAGVLDEAQGAWIRHEASQAALRAVGDHADVRWLRTAVGDDAVEAMLRELGVLAAAGDGELELATPPEGAEPALVRTVSAARELWQAWHGHERAACRRLGRCTFDDLERLAVRAVRSDAVRAALRARWTMVLVDEFQDTNARQLELLDAIGGDQLFMVGDEWQSIYRFRGADVDVFRRQRRELGSRVVPMRENFRSAAPVLDVVNAAFAHESTFGQGYEPVLPGSEAQRAAAGPRVELLVVPSHADEEELAASELDPAASGREREARRVAEHVARRVVEDGVAPERIALLYGASTGVEAYEDALRAWGLPVLRVASGGYYDQRDVRDALALLSAARNRADELASITALAGPLGALSWSELDDVVHEARAEELPMLDAAARQEGEGPRRVADLVEEVARASHDCSLVDVVARATWLPALEAGAAQECDGAARVANLRRLVELAASAEGIGIRDLAGFLEFVEAQRRHARVGEASLDDERAGGVRMMTVHASKGLEFDHVYVVEAGARPRSRSVRPLADADGAVHVPAPGDDGRLCATGVLEELAEADAQLDAQEQHRRWYVACTRARESLVISGCCDLRPKKDGMPRAVPAGLAWLVEILEAPEPHELGAGPATALGGLVRCSATPPLRRPVPVQREEAPRTRLATPVPARAAAAPAAVEDVPDEGERHALRTALAGKVAEARDERWRQLDGTRLHDAVARLLDAARAGTPLASLLEPAHGPWLSDRARERLAPVVASSTFTSLAARRARTEVPYVSRRAGARTAPSRAAPGTEVAVDARDVDAGRLDALAILDDGTWWVVDWKTTLPEASADAWAEHGAQLARYGGVALAAGAPGCVATLVPLDRPGEPVSWRLEGRPDGDGDREPPAADHPASDRPTGTPA